MHVDITPRRFDLTPGIPQPLSITISNTGTVIGGYAVRVLGADPSWVTIEDAEVSLFPEESRTISVLISVPSGMTAGERRLSVQVRELTPPEESLVEEVVFTVPEAAAVQVRADPMAVSAGRTARLNLLVDNTGNTRLHRRLHGQDPEGQVRFRFDPPIVTLEPGEHALVDLRASAKQPFLGNPVIRPMELRLVDPDYVPPAPPETPPVEADAATKLTAPRLPRKGRKKKAAERRIDDEAIPALANATFIQKPLVSRGPMSLLGLLVAVTVFALVITVALSRIVGQSAADRNLALEIAAAREAGSTVGTAGLSGRVTELTSAAGAPGVAVSVYASDDVENALVTTATAKDGSWKVGKLPAGDYKVTFKGAGFLQMWYPQATTADDAEDVTLEPGKQQPGLDVALGGIPASIAGTVDGPDVSAATLTLKRPLTGMGITTGDTASAVDAQQGATVMSVPIGDDGSFVLENVPSPSVYDLVVEKPGFATSTQRVDVSAGEERTGVEITLRQGDGVISGTLSSAGGVPLGEAAITATSGQLSVPTMSVNEGADIGSFTLRGLPTPATFTLVVTKEGYASQTVTIALAEGQRLDGVGVTLNSSSGRLDGQVLTAPDDDPAAGVLVSVTNGVQTVQTASTSASDEEEGGLWSVTGLDLPGEYTVTFSRSDLESQTIGVSLDAEGNVTAVGDGDGDGIGDTSEVGAIVTSLRSATAEIDAQVLQRTARGASSFAPLGEATITLTSSTSTYRVTSASLPARDLGRYRIVGIPPGSYTLSIGRAGVAPFSDVIELAAGDVYTKSTQLEPPAKLTGTIRSASGDPVGQGWIVDLYKYDEYGGAVYQSVRSTAGGRFEFSDIDAPQAYVVEVRRTLSADPSGSTTVNLTASEEKDITVKAQANG